MDDPRARPVGIVLAGGLGRRMGGAKAVVSLAGRPLISYPLEALRGVPVEVAVVAKPDTALPALPGTEIWIEPASPQHPLVGICHALRMAAGRSVLVCASDLPFITSAALRRLAQADPRGAPAVVAASSEGSLQPLLGCYQPEAALALEAAAREAVAPTRRAVAAIGPRLLQLDDDEMVNVNSRHDLLRAEQLISQT